MHIAVRTAFCTPERNPRCTVILFWPFTIALLIVGFILRFWCVNAPRVPTTMECDDRGGPYGQYRR